MLACVCKFSHRVTEGSAIVGHPVTYHTQQIGTQLLIITYYYYYYYYYFF